jgi:hypothetical protein
MIPVFRIFHFDHVKIYYQYSLLSDMIFLESDEEFVYDYKVIDYLYDFDYL